MRELKIECRRITCIHPEIFCIKDGEICEEVIVNDKPIALDMDI